MSRKTNTQRIDEIEAKINSPWYKTIEVWALVVSILALGIATYLSKTANQIAEINNKLEQSSIRSQHISYCYQLINELSEELKTDTVLSPQLVAKFKSHTNILQPFIQDINNDQNKYDVSPGRGILLNAIFTLNLNESKIFKLFPKSNFESASLIDVEWDSVTLYAGKMSKSYLNRTKILKSIIDSTDFNGSIISDSKFDYSKILNHTTFNQCVFENSSFIGCVIEENSEFIDCIFKNVNFMEAKIKNNNSYLWNCIFEGVNFKCTTFENIGFKNAKFNQCLWDGCTFINCFLDQSSINLNQLSKYNPIEISNLQGIRGTSTETCKNFKIKMINTTISKNNPLISNEHFLSYHTLRDTIIRNHKFVIANFKK